MFVKYVLYIEMYKYVYKKYIYFIRINIREVFFSVVKKDIMIWKVI